MKIGYIINRKSTNCHYLKYVNGKHIWAEKGTGNLVEDVKNEKHPSIFETPEDAYGYAYNVANLDNNEFEVQEMLYNAEYVENEYVKLKK